MVLESVVIERLQVKAGVGVDYPIRTPRYISIDMVSFIILKGSLLIRLEDEFNSLIHEAYHKRHLCI